MPPTALRTAQPCRGGAVVPRCWPLLLVAACASAAAQSSAGGSGLRISASLDASLSATRVERPAGESFSDLIAQVRPGVQGFSQTGRIKGSFSYGLSLIQHSRKSEGSELQNSLNAALSASLVENFAFVDAVATISQRALSPFGRQSVPGSVDSNGNRTEVATVSISPYLRGAFSDVATYEARVNASATDARHSRVGDSNTTGALLQLNSASRGAVIGWGLQASHQRSDFRAGRATVNDRATASVTASPDPELLFTLRGGREATDVGSASSAGRQSYDNWGASASWRPNERTTANFDTDRRYFGQSHAVLIEHRFPQSSLRFTSTRDSSNSGDPNGVGQPITAYQLLFSLLASAYPDPVLRDQAVLQQLRIQGTDPNAIVAGGFVNSAVTLQTRNDLAWTYSGRRTSLTLQAFTSDSKVIDPQALQPGNGSVRQRGATTTLSYRLTPTASTSLGLTQLKTSGTATQAGNDLKSATLTWTDQIGLRTSASVNARYSVFNAPTDAYRESALTASLSHRF